jgi:two-component system chemotaxis response regulator CheY
MTTHSTASTTVEHPLETTKETPKGNTRSAAMFSGQSTRGGVLVIDDEPDVRKVVRLTLEKAVYYVVEAEDGGQAIQVLNEGEHPMVLDVIITDIRMPRINGLEAMTYFQREYPSVHLIVLTGFPDLEMATDLLKRGITDYLVKPVEPEKLIMAVTHAINQQRISWL